MRQIDIKQVESENDLNDIRILFKAYGLGLGIDLSFQEFDIELARLPGKYTPPTGGILIARDDTGRSVGCVAVRPIDSQCCEMKRLYVLPDMRGTGLGKDLVFSILEMATNLGYRQMRLDTLPSMHSALALYEKTGFTSISPYYKTPIEGTVFLEKQLLSG